MANKKGIMKNEEYSRNRYEKRGLTLKGAHKKDLNLDEEAKIDSIDSNLEVSFNRNMSFVGTRD